MRASSNGRGIIGALALVASAHASLARAQGVAPPRPNALPGPSASNPLDAPPLGTTDGPRVVPSITPRTSGTLTTAALGAPRIALNAPSATGTGEGPVALPEALEPRAGGLTADVAARRAALANPGVDFAHAAEDAARAQQTEAAWQMVPALTLSARYSRLSPLPSSAVSIPNVSVISHQITQTPPDYTCADDTQNTAACTRQIVLQTPLVNQYAAHASVSVPLTDIPFRLLQYYQGAGLLAEARRLDADVARAQAALTAREAFYEYARALGQSAVASQAVVAAGQRRTDAARLVDAGRVARIELLRADAALAELRRVGSTADDGATLAATQLRQIVGMATDAPLSLGERLDTTLEVPDDADALVHEAMHARAELQSLQRQIGSAEANLAGTRAGQYPSVAVVGNFDYANPNPRFFPQVPIFIPTWDVTAQVTWSPTQTALATTGVARFSAQRAQLVAQLRQAQRSIEMEVRSQWVATRAAAGRVATERAALAAAEEAYRARRDRMTAGTASPVEVMEAETDRLRARLALVDAAIDLRIGLARLRRARGVREDSPGAGR